MIGYQRNDAPPEPKLFCWNCGDIIEENETYIDLNDRPYCNRCFAEWLSDHTRYNE